ncbi:PREDICTED: uncharacterized protein LOC109183632 [Ipomoea nil]|uniref:uncharacterized protein LOC109183632 n=1 Tax=Ipomoea nil TaxID=35883 RepID=UPI000901008F|nr:PREDICTED: uncharacterized protein LOC109183632 [Ipomoea nil]
MEVKNKWTIVEGTTPAPDRTHAQYSAWRRCNLMICSWIYKAVHPLIAQSVMHIQNAREVWNNLKKRFSQRDAHRISSLHLEIQNLKQGDMSVNDYYTRCRILWEQMNELRPLPICICVPQCSCNAFDEIRNEKEVDQIISFLQGLNEEYNSLKSGILVLDPMPDLHKVLVMAEKFERQLKIESLSLSHLEVNHANAVQTNPADDQEVVAAVGYNNNKRNNSFGTGNKSAKCTYCGMTGHTIEKFYKKHGYPPGWVQIGQNHPTSTAVTLTKSPPDEDFFETYHPVKGTKVNLPDGKQAEVMHMRHIKLRDDLNLENVPHIPSFNFNIISVSQLLQESSYELIFNSHQCLLRSNHGKPIGFAEEGSGLYLLTETPEVQTSVQDQYIMSCSNEVWHKRLGHFPFNKMHLLADISVSHSKKVACDICHFAKHKKSPFSCKQHYVKDLF